MVKVPYKIKFLILYVLSITVIVFSIYYMFEQFNKSDVSNISIENFQYKYEERNSFFNNSFYKYNTTIKALTDNVEFNNYINNKENSTNIESLFLTIKQSLPCITKIQYIDTNGMEKIAVEGTSEALFHDKALSRVIPIDELKNRQKEEYFQKFIQLPQGEIGISQIGTQQNYYNTNEAIVRFGMTVFDSNSKKKGILIINICLKTFFKLLDKNTLYHVFIIDNKGQFISHYNPIHGVDTETFYNYTIFDEFGEKNAKNILKNKEYLGEGFYSNRLKNFDNGQDLKLLFSLKFENLTKQSIQDSNNIIYFIILFGIIFSPIVFYFGNIPDFLTTKMEKQISINENTNLPNRIALIRDLEEKEFKNCVIVLIKIKNITKIQNLYGYKLSQQLLIEIANYLTQYKNTNIKKTYIISHGTFSFQYQYKTKEIDFKIFLEKLLKDIEAEHFCIANGGIDILIDVAISSSNPSKITNDINELKEAEIALDNGLENKQDISLFSYQHTQKQQRNKDNIELAKKIKYAIENDTIEMHYQPIFNNFTEKIEKYESLIRLRYKEELIYPDQFLPIAKELNKYQLLTYIVIDKSFKFFQDKDFEFSINISMIDIENENFIDFLFERIKYYKVSHKLVLEIVESESIEDYNNFYNFIKKVKKLGCKIAIDDFGSGYSNFEHLLNLSDHIDYLKIDGSLVKNISTDSKIQILVGSLKFLCDNLRLQTIAEYVEDPTTLEYINSIGIDYSQGYLIGKPSKDLV